MEGASQLIQLRAPEVLESLLARNYSRQDIDASLSVADIPRDKRCARPAPHRIAYCGVDSCYTISLSLSLSLSISLSLSLFLLSTYSPPALHTHVLTLTLTLTLTPPRSDMDLDLLVAMMESARSAGVAKLEANITSSVRFTQV